MMERSLQSTEERILLAAIDIMHEKGFKAATTKEIAKAASVSEMTLFRKFGTKKALLDAAVEQFSYVLSIKKIFEEKVTGELEHDLALVSHTYQKFMKQNEKIFLLVLKEWNTNPQIGAKAAENPKQLKNYLMQYLENMKEDGKLKPVNIEAQVMCFLWMNLGFVTAQYISGRNVAVVDEEEFIEQSVKTFARGLLKG